jgi:hypothetical protein
MPNLPSGKKLVIGSDALFDHGRNWFDCPKNHFWYWVADPDMGPPPYDPNSEILMIARHALVPTTMEDAKKFIRVYELNSENKLLWWGDWLSRFPSFIELDNADHNAWNEWMLHPDVSDLLDQTIQECQRLAKIAQEASGYAVFKSANDPILKTKRRTSSEAPSD